MKKYLVSVVGADTDCYSKDNLDVIYEELRKSFDVAEKQDLSVVSTSVYGKYFITIFEK